MAEKSKIKTLHIVLLTLVVLTLIWSGIHPKDYFVWMLEVLPTVIGLVLVIRTYKKFQLTDLLYILIAIHGIILCIGGKYTYAEVPIGLWVQELMGTARNNYDRLGHIAQGFIPAILAREILTRLKVVKNGKWLFLFATCICVAFSAFYELIEWWVAIFTGDGSAEFLGTQGDIWDTQWDIFLCLIGALSSQLFLGSVHDRQLEKL